jgi:hypothetical protein
MDPFFVELEKRRQQNKETSPEAEADRIVAGLKERISFLSEKPHGTTSVTSLNLDPIIADLVKAKVGEVQIKQGKSSADQPQITYRVAW